MGVTVKQNRGYAALKPLLRFLPSRQEIDEASFHRGQTVSLIRRMIAFYCDFLCAGATAAVLPMFLLPFRQYTVRYILFWGIFGFLPVLLLKAVQLSINPCSMREYQAQKF